jgi:hypothetical protein
MIEDRSTRKAYNARSREPYRDRSTTDAEVQAQEAPPSRGEEAHEQIEGN